MFQTYNINITTSDLLNRYVYIYMKYSRSLTPILHLQHQKIDHVQ